VEEGPLFVALLSVAPQTHSWKCSLKAKHFLRSRWWRFSVSAWRTIVSFISSSPEMNFEEEVILGVFALLGCYAALPGSWLPTFRVSLSVSPSRALRCLTVEHGTDPIPLEMGPTGCPETSVTTNQRRVTSHKSEDLIYTATKACNHAKLSSVCYRTRNKSRKEAQILHISLLNSWQKRGLCHAAFNDTLSFRPYY
jgi:hypothetical protein